MMGKIGFQKARQNLKVGVVCSIINFEHITKEFFFLSLFFHDFVRWTSKEKIKGSKKGKSIKPKKTEDAISRRDTVLGLRTKSNRKLKIQLTYVDYEKLGIFFQEL